MVLLRFDMWFCFWLQCVGTRELSLFSLSGTFGLEARRRQTPTPYQTPPLPGCWPWQSFCPSLVYRIGISAQHLLVLQTFCRGQVGQVIILLSPTLLPLNPWRSEASCWLSPGDRYTAWLSLNLAMAGTPLDAWCYLRQIDVTCLSLQHLHFHSPFLSSLFEGTPKVFPNQMVSLGEFAKQFLFFFGEQYYDMPVLRPWV